MTDELVSFEEKFSVLRYASAPGPWYAASKGDFWYIINARTGRSKKIGRIGAVRVNYCDVAVREAIKRNQTKALKLECDEYASEETLRAAEYGLTLEQDRWAQRQIAAGDR